MSVYYGVVRGGIVELPKEVHLTEGSVVEIRPATIDAAADRRLQEALLAAGLIRRVKPLGERSPEPATPPVAIQGPPLFWQAVRGRPTWPPSRRQSRSRSV